jgi:hypothetical protein
VVKTSLPIASRFNPGSFNHKDNRFFGSPWPVHDTFWDRKPLPWVQLDRPAFQVNDEVALHNVEKLIFIVMLVPVERSLHDTQPDNPR